MCNLGFWSDSHNRASQFGSLCIKGQMRHSQNGFCQSSKHCLCPFRRVPFQIDSRYTGMLANNSNAVNITFFFRPGIYLTTAIRSIFFCFQVIIIHESCIQKYYEICNLLYIPGVESIRYFMFLR